MRTNKEIVERLFDMLYSLAGKGCLTKQEEDELISLEIDWYTQNMEE